ncbi:hypothetical protein [Caballeronia zhejiangensis]|uniref:hypothetical protein n=1 Tax=Caballeronia zhejiangensis TaxID=871203 RepID=UPI00158A6576|nr:hypothetical protein [Caballeronia zhejiangensis]MCG7403026.1 hypothetical protein [Caballeronia zhejiangensis]MCI1043850.1 hypothetical protein [Caballeronia zhejiangensis]
MYSIKPYFVEIFPEHVAGDGWTAIAQFSRQSDYSKHHITVHKIRFRTQVAAATRGGAESAAANWARAFVAYAPDMIEASLDTAREVAQIDPLTREKRS